ncbi:MAG: hypothetical protein R6U55_09905 [Desulfovermiculus sp.]
MSMKNLGQAKILGVLALFFLLNASSYIKPEPDNRLEQWLEVEEWEGKISYEMNFSSGAVSSVTAGALPGTGRQTLEVLISLERDGESTWRGSAEGTLIHEAEAELSGKGKWTIQQSGHGSVSGRAYLQINIKRGHYVLGISGIDAIPIRHREYKAVGGQVLIDVGTTITGQSLKRVWAHMDTPESSDFYEKVEAHEEHHLRQFDEIEP